LQEEGVDVGLCEANFEVNHVENEINFTPFPDQKLYLDDKDFEDQKSWSEKEVMDSRGFLTFLFVKFNKIDQQSCREPLD